MFEYPVWFWHRWPIVNTYIRNKTNPVSALFNDIFPLFQSIFEINAVVDIEKTLNIKIDAINKHHSQMENIVKDERWGTLKSVDRGEWLDILLYKCEWFVRYKI